MTTEIDQYPRVIPAVDIVLMTVRDGRLKILVHRRQQDAKTFPGQLALPGGHIHAQEDADSLMAARRVLKTKVKVDPSYLEQLYTFADGARDPSGWSISIAYYALVPSALLEHMDRSVTLVDAEAIPRLAFDHNRIVDVAIERVRNKASFSSLPCYLLPEKFTLGMLQAAYEQVMNTTLNKANFRKKLEELNFVEPIEGEMQMGKQRPAQLYRVKPGRLAVFNKTI